MLLEYYHDGYPQLAITFVSATGKIECFGDMIILDFVSEEYYGYALPFPLRVPFYPDSLIYGHYADPMELDNEGKLTFTYKNSVTYMTCPKRHKIDYGGIHDKNLVTYELPCPSKFATLFKDVCIINRPEIPYTTNSLLRPANFGGTYSFIYDFPEFHKKEGKRTVIGYQTFMPMLTDKFYVCDYEHIDCMCYSSTEREVIRCIYPNAIYLAKLPSKRAIIDRYVDARSDNSVVKKRKLDVSSSEEEDTVDFYNRTVQIYKSLKENTDVLEWKSLEKSPFPLGVQLNVEKADLDSLYEPLKRLDLDDKARKRVETIHSQFPVGSDEENFFRECLEICATLKYDEKGDLIRTSDNMLAYYNLKNLEKKLRYHQKILISQCYDDSKSDEELQPE
jgi:hypothetical protein